jgi:AcrR family transcriptional regulator
MPRPSRKTEILTAAVASFAAYGYAGTRIRTIADRAGVSEAALYRHYPSVEELAATVYVDSFTEYSERVAAAIRREGKQGEEREPEQDPRLQHAALAERQLRAVVRETLGLFRENPDAFLFALEVLPAFLRRLPEGFAYPLEQVEAVVVAGQRAGSVRPGQSNVLAAVFLGAVLRPIQLSVLAAPGSLDLLTGTQDSVIEDAAVAALVITEGGQY